MTRRKKKNSNKTSSNIILSDVNPTSCYDEKEDCERECRGYRCSDNCDRSSTQCQEGETGCYGSEETCKSSCTPVYRCNSVSGVVKEYKACAGESGCYPGESQANANCVKTYSCAGSGPTGPTGCNPSNTFGPPCASGATNCYNSSTSCTDSCKGYRCSNCTVAGAKCDGSEPNCYPTSAACSGSTSCPNVYRCTDNCTASRTPCGSDEEKGGKCFTSQNDCQRLCQATYRCTPDKKCQAGYISCSTGESGKTCFTDSTACRYSLYTNCQKGYRCSAKCAPERMCDIGEPGCHETQQLCITNCKGYRCDVNCAEGQGCTPEDSTCYISESSCKTTCVPYSCDTVDHTCVRRYVNCTETEINKTCFTTANCLNECGKTVFDRINANEQDLKYRIVNVATGRQIQGNTNPAFVNVKDELDYTAGEQLWTFNNVTNNQALIVSSGKQLACGIDQTDGRCNGDYYLYNPNSEGYAKILISPSSDPSERANGICNLYSQNNSGWISLGHINVSPNGFGWRDNGDADDPRYLKVQWNKADRFAKWKIVPYKNGVRI